MWSVCFLCELVIVSTQHRLSSSLIVSVFHGLCFAKYHFAKYPFAKYHFRKYRFVSFRFAKYHKPPSSHSGEPGWYLLWIGKWDPSSRLIPPHHPPIGKLDTLAASFVLVMCEHIFIYRRFKHFKIHRLRSTSARFFFPEVCLEASNRLFHILQSTPTLGAGKRGT